MKHRVILFLLAGLFACKNNTTENQKPKTDISDISTKEFTEFKVEDSKYLTKEQIWKPFEDVLLTFTKEDYKRIYPLVYDQDIPSIQQHIISGQLTYENLVKFYLFRIKRYDRFNNKSLNSVIALNPNIIKEAQAKDIELKNHSQDIKRSVYGIPILLKDNVNAQGMSTTAGATALINNKTDDAYIVKALKRKGALILGKANLSEWAYFFCGDCPSGYSAVGGQTFNPYGKKTFDTGGSSSGSAVAVAANFCTAAIGSETSGSILSPSSQNSVVGLKPTIGLVSRSGIIPISSTLDTAGPITRTVIDNAILLDAIYGFDDSDSKSLKSSLNQYAKSLSENPIQGKRFGVLKKLMEDSLYLNATKQLKQLGAQIIEFEEPDVDLPDFLRLLNLDMKKDLPDYLRQYASKNVKVLSVSDVIDFNKNDSTKKMPYGQKLFYGIIEDKATEEEFNKIKATLNSNGKLFFDKPFSTYKLDAFLSINNYHAGFAAVAEYPAITIPMGYTEKGQPKGLTIIAKPLEEKKLLNWALEYEKATQARVAPKEYVK